MKRKLISLMVVLMMLVTVVLPVSAAASSFKTEVRQSIAPIVYYQSLDGMKVPVSLGTCFFIGKTAEDPQYVVTNHHVVEDFLAEGAGEGGYMIDGYNLYDFKGSMRVHFDADDSVEAYIVDYDEQADIAILRLENPTEKRTALKLKVPTDEMIGSTIYAVGFPSISDNSNEDPVSRWSAEDATVTTGSISRLLTTSGTGVKKVQIDADIRKGNSGGPLVDAEGNVLGVNTYSFVNQHEERLYDAINIEEVINLCETNSIPVTIVGSDNGMSWIAAAVAAVVVIAIVLVLVLRRKKATAPVSAAAPVAAPVAPAAPAAPVSGNELRFQCTSGAFAGKRFSIDGTVRIGRDPARNDLVYPGNTQGISGVHCILILKDNVLYLQDLGSTYGTFVNGGQRLAANQPVALKIGDRFTLGSDRESFVITPRGGL